MLSERSPLPESNRRPLDQETILRARVGIAMRLQALCKHRASAGMSLCSAQMHLPLARLASERAFRRNTAERVYTIEAAHNPEVAGSNPAPATGKAPETGPFGSFRRCRGSGSVRQRRGKPRRRGRCRRRPSRASNGHGRSLRGGARLGRARGRRSGARAGASARHPSRARHRPGVHVAPRPTRALRPPSARPSTSPIARAASSVPGAPHMMSSVGFATLAPTSV